MKRLPRFALLAALALAPSAVQSQSMAMSPSTVGVGPHGYDWLVGTWACTNSIPSPIGGPRNTTLTFGRSNVASALTVRVTGNDFDESGYLAYAPKTKTWWNPFAFADGSHASESTTDTGKKVIYTGSYFDASGKMTQIRDTYATVNMTKQTDLGQYKSGAVWKTAYNITCTKS